MSAGLRTLGLALASLLALGATPAAAAPGYAIVIGTNASPPEDPSLAPLRFADDDALRYADLFGRLGVAVRLLTVLDTDTQRRHPGRAATTTPPTRAAVLAAVDEVQAKLRTDPGPVYLVFSGHGSADDAGEPLLALLDESLTRSLLYERILARLDAPAVHLIVDACNAGAVVGVRGPFDDAVEAPRVTVTDPARAAVIAPRALARFPHVGAVVATSAGQASHEWTRIQSGVFTHTLLSGLAGAADINGDLRLAYSEIQAFVGSAHSRVQDPRARPEVLAIPPARDHTTPLVSLAALDGPFLRGDAGALGHFFVELAGGRRYLDAHLEAGRTATLLLPADTAGFVRAEGAEAELPARRDGIIELDDLTFRTVRLASRGTLDQALQADLFAAPFDVAYYRGFVDSRRVVPVDLAVERAVPLSERWTWKERTGVALWATAGAAAVGAVVTGVWAGSTRDQFEQATTQRASTDLARRYDQLTAATWVQAGVAAAAAGAGTWLWFSARPSRDGAAVAISGSF